MARGTVAHLQERFRDLLADAIEHQGTFAVDDEDGPLVVQRYDDAERFMVEVKVLPMGGDDG